MQSKVFSYALVVVEDTTGSAHWVKDPVEYDLGGYFEIFQNMSWGRYFEKFYKMTSCGYLKFLGRMSVWDNGPPPYP